MLLSAVHLGLYRVVVIKESCILKVIPLLLAAILTNIEVPGGVTQPAEAKELSCSAI